MKKFLCVLLLSFLFVSPALAEVDLTGMTLDELVALKDQINLAIWESEDWQEVTVPQGLWKVGEDIPAGHWTLQPVKGAYSFITIGSVLDENGKEVSYRSDDYYSVNIESKDSFLYNEGSSVVTADLELEEGCYVEISSGDVIFTPYGGKPSLGFASSSGVSVPHEEKIELPQDDGFNFKDVARYPDKYIDTTADLTGYVMQVIGSKEEGEIDIRLATSGTYDDVIYLYLDASHAPDFNILEDDHLSVNVTWKGNYTYESIMGSKITLPLAYVNSVSLIE